MESKLERLQNFRDALAAHDRSLEQSLQKTTDIGFQGQHPLRALFNSIRNDYPDLVPEYRLYGQIPVVKQQVAHALAMVEGQIRTVERELTAYEQRNQLSSHVHHSRHLIRERIEEGDGLRNNYESILRNGLGPVMQWRSGSRQTLKNVFVSPWNSEEFERIVRVAEQSTNSPDTGQFVLDDGIAFLQSVDQQLYLAEGKQIVATIPDGKKIFIGHGRSPIWKDLRDFVRDKLKLESDEFNAIATAGYFTPERVKEMLDDAAFAFVVLTAEDEQPDGTVRARENVVHETGLFQGRLGFRKAIVALEQGCHTFSNISGLTYLQFPSGNIRAIFEDVRDTLLREGLIPSPKV